MAIYRGVSGVTRAVTKQSRGVGGVARQITKEYRGVNGIARLVFSGFDHVLNTDESNASVTTFNSYTLEAKDGTINIAVDFKGTSSSKGRTIGVLVYGDLPNSTISFDYVGTGYTTFYSTIEYKEASTEKVLYTKALDGSGSVNRTISADTYRLRFDIWCAGTSNRAASLVISNLLINGERIF